MISIGYLLINIGAGLNLLENENRK